MTELLLVEAVGTIHCDCILRWLSDSNAWHQNHGMTATCSRNILLTPLIR